MNKQQQKLEALKAYLHAEVDLQLDAMNKLGYLTEANVDEMDVEDIGLTLSVRDRANMDQIKTAEIECTITCFEDDSWYREFRALNIHTWEQGMATTIQYGVAYIEPEEYGGITMDEVPNIIKTVRVTDAVVKPELNNIEHIMQNAEQRKSAVEYMLEYVIGDYLTTLEEAQEEVEPSEQCDVEMFIQGICVIGWAFGIDFNKLDTDGLIEQDFE